MEEVRRDEGDLMDYIIGGGISALTYAYYNKGTVIADNIKIQNNPAVFIQKNKYTKKLLEDLNIQAKTLECRINFEKSKEEIFKDKIGEEISKRFLGMDKIANVGKHLKLEIYDIKESDICRKLYEELENRVLVDTVEKIDKEFIYLKSGKILPYERIITTMHFKKFEKVYPFWKSNSDCSFIYFSINDNPEKEPESFITYCKNEDVLKKIVYNNILNQTFYEYKKETDGCCKLPSRIDKKVSPPPENIFFVGRFATGNPWWRLEDSIFIAQKGLVLSEFLNTQKRFDEIIEKQQNKTREERVKDMVLHIYSEANELIEQTDWKTNKVANKTIRASTVLEEGTDIIKLVYGILLQYNYTERQIYEMFFEKDDRNWSRFLNDYYGGV